MTRKPFTKSEIELCAYIARFGRSFIDEEQICFLFDVRSVDAIKLAVRNIASMLHEEGYDYSHTISPLSGKPPGEQGRRTHWDVVSTLVDLTESAFRDRVDEIRSGHSR